MNDRSGVTRRRLLAAGAAAAATGVTGCVDGSTPERSSGEGFESVYAAFFTLENAASHVAGDAVDVDSAVPVGQHGHGWSPQFDLLRDVVDQDAFVHLGIDGFQRWVDDTVPTLREEHPEVALIDASEGVDLREFDGDEHGGSNGHDEGDGEADGNHDGDVDETGQGDEDHGSMAEDGGHGHGSADPHLWLDPLRYAEVVENVADGFADIDPDRAADYHDNAAEYVETLEELDEEIRTTLADRDTDVVVLAGHDSFGYFADRYDLELHSPHGVSPDTEPSPTEISETIELVNQTGSAVVLYDHFEGSRLADSIVEQTPAEETRALSPVESVTEEWRSQGLDGYVPQMREINLPAFAAAVGATASEEAR